MVNYQENHLDDVFSVLSDPTRRKIIEELSKGEKTVKKLAEPFDMSLPAVTKHLKVLEKAQIVSFRKEGRYKYYFLQPEKMKDAIEWLHYWRSFWEDRLTRLEQFLMETKEEDE
ncbi:ArsR/SmtB family transcription factor [Bacillus kexueae]|uniref:ArsR/SmtB family transcription factor n=1 Tax=Aeribacillus kexueae TaxID=2078952 RepID=UPI001FB01ED9|nr:metalloregulator ArsR/SmtB family transcription factor [Bacillus kexueae]